MIVQQATTARRTLTSEDDLHSPQPNKATSHLPPSEMLVDVAVRREFLRRIARMLQGKRQPSG
jgi:hypothetical protein